MEDNSENVKIGRQLHENSYQRDKEYLIDNKINIDFIREKEIIEVHEIKKSKKIEKSHEYQLLYYLYYLKKYKNIEKLKGYLNYPLIKEEKEVELTEENEKQLRKIILEISKIIKNNKPPNVKKKRICNSCSYYELCYI